METNGIITVPIDKAIREHYDSVLDYVKNVGYTSFGILPLMLCNDGMEISIQYSPFHHCNIFGRMDLIEGHTFDTAGKTGLGYKTFECGYPNEFIPELSEYADEPESVPNTIYNEVPLEVLENVIKKHRGIYGYVKRT